MTAVDWWKSREAHVLRAR